MYEQVHCEIYCILPLELLAGIPALSGEQLPPPCGVWSSVEQANVNDSKKFDGRRGNYERGN
jgi:hypothetical protein